ncbi:MAG: hypothetical protein ACPLN0_06190 [Candidatus Hydrothermia bacterium]
MHSEIIECISLVGAIVFSWSVVGFIAIILFRKPLLQILEQFTRRDVHRARLGPLEIERKFNKLAQQGQEAFKKMNQLIEVMAESRLLELEIPEEMFGGVFDD